MRIVFWRFFQELRDVVTVNVSQTNAYGNIIIESITGPIEFLHKFINVTPEHKTSHKGQFFEIEIYASYES